MQLFRHVKYYPGSDLWEPGKTLGDYSNGAPPLPIPNREVKPISANGTAFAGE